MPAGVSWIQYTKFLTCAMLAMMAGSQMVHLYYKPLDDLPIYIEREITQHKNEKADGGTNVTHKEGDNV